MDVGRLLFVLRIVVPIFLFLATILALQILTDLSWVICAVIGLFVGLLDVFVIMPYTEKSIQDSPE